MKPFAFLSVLAVACGSGGSEPCQVVDTPNGALLLCPGAEGVEVLDGSDGRDGVDGRDGADGQNGADGADGADGVDGQNGVDGADGVDGASLEAKRVFVCEPSELAWDDGEALVEAWPGPVFYDLGTFWMVTCGARVEFFLEGGGIDAVDSDRFFLRDASDDPDAPVVCYVDYLTITLDPASSSVTYQFQGQPENDLRRVCDCHGDC